MTEGGVDGDGVGMAIGAFIGGTTEGGTGNDNGTLGLLAIMSGMGGLLSLTKIMLSRATRPAPTASKSHSGGICRLEEFDKTTVEWGFVGIDGAAGEGVGGESVF